MNKTKTIEHPLVGDRVTFLTPDDCKGEYELVEVHLAPGGGNDLHFHTSYYEEFEAVQGDLYIEVDQKEVILRPGEKAIAPLHCNHRFFNPNWKEPIVFRTKIVPARGFENMLRIAYGLANDGKVTKKGVPKNPLEMAVMFYLGESYLPNIPLFIQKGIFNSLYFIAKLTGTHQKLLNKYCL